MRIWISAVVIVTACSRPAPTPRVFPQPAAAPIKIPQIDVRAGETRAVPFTQIEIAVGHIQRAKPGISGRRGIECAPPVPASALLRLSREGTVEHVAWSSGTYKVFGFRWTVEVRDDAVTVALAPDFMRAFTID